MHLKSENIDIILSICNVPKLYSVTLKILMSFVNVISTRALVLIWEQRIKF